ncbi:hypothetical protein [Pontibacter sp. G13]|uniref:hypothetical protein n=1 Tax=Pontibacter sp. G13 TaxID=3074898 RepID=UPI00288C3F28|nr:hypothetical protein [Pontibacter sp. G13]WNJ18976.1 hypothetical protein RJD25_00675 [Pontibacter sp. G13]
MEQSSHNYDDIIEHGYEFKFEHYFTRGWELFTQNAGNLYAWMFVGLLIVMVSAIIPPLLLWTVPAFSAAFYLYLNKAANGEKPVFNDFFQGFQPAGQLVLVTLFTAVLVMIGFMLFFLPGIYLAVAFGFGIPLVALGGLSATDALGVSRKVITKQWWMFLVMGIVMGLIAQFIPLLSLPFIVCVNYAMFEDIMGSPAELESQIDEMGAEGEF